MNHYLAKEKPELVALCCLPGVTVKRIGDMLTLFGSPAGAWEAVCGGAALPAAGKPETTQSGWQELALETDPRAKLEAIERAGVRVLVRGGPGYPPLLAETRVPPWVLFYRGLVPDPGQVGIAIVGSRKATPYGREVSRWLAGELARGGVNIVSGAAYGIDSAAHAGALDAGGFTTAVLGCGVDVIYPRSSSSLLSRTAETGCILSEYPPGTHPSRYRFPERNRIIAGMSRGVVVVEAGVDSGALITADHALAEGRDVMAIPGQLFSVNSKGTNALLRNGAAMVTCADDVLSELGLQTGRHTLPDNTASLITSRSIEERKVLGALVGGATDTEELSRVAGLRAADTLSVLARLEVEGAVIRGPGGRYHPSAP